MNFSNQICKTLKREEKNQRNCLQVNANCEEDKTVKDPRPSFHEVLSYTGARKGMTVSFVENEALGNIFHMLKLPLLILGRIFTACSFCSSTHRELIQ